MDDKTIDGLSSLDVKQNRIVAEWMCDFLQELDELLEHGPIESSREEPVKHQK